MDVSEVYIEILLITSVEYISTSQVHLRIRRLERGED